MAETAVITQQPKWFLKSKTIWGTIIAAITMAAPIISQVTGIDLTPAVDAAGQAGEAATTVVDTTLKAVGAVVSTWLLVWGRFTKKIESITVAPNGAPVLVTVPGIVKEMTEAVTAHKQKISPGRR